MSVKWPRHKSGKQPNTFQTMGQDFSPCRKLSISVSGFGFRVSGFGFRVSGFGFRVWVQILGFRNHGLRFRAYPRWTLVESVQLRSSACRSVEDRLSRLCT